MNHSKNQTMKIKEFRKLIREEVKRTLKEDQNSGYVVFYNTLENEPEGLSDEADTFQEFMALLNRLQKDKTIDINSIVPARIGINDNY
jgi:hypothetical protein